MSKHDLNDCGKASSSSSDSISGRGWNQGLVDSMGRFMSESIDVLKGCFVPFMVGEHTRSALRVKLDAILSPNLFFMSQMACSMDMTCFSLAYGFSTHRSYLVDSDSNERAKDAKDHPIKRPSKWRRAAKSVFMILGVAVLTSMGFEWQVMDYAPSPIRLFRILVQENMYWDFLITFPWMLLMGMLTTGPLLKLADKCSKTTPINAMTLVVYIVLLSWPVLLSGIHIERCGSEAWRRYATMLFGCEGRIAFAAQRFSAISYMYYYNTGAVLSHLTMKKERAEVFCALTAPFRVILRRVCKGCCQPACILGSVNSVDATTLGFGSYLRRSIFKVSGAHFALLVLAVIGIEVYYFLPLMTVFWNSWEYLEWNGYKRFPQSYAVMFGWGLMTKMWLAFSLLLVSVTSKNSALGEWLVSKCDVTAASSLSAPRRVSVLILRSVCFIFKRVKAVLEHLGANVVLYLMISNLINDGFYHNSWHEVPHTKPVPNVSGMRLEIELARNPRYTPAQWEIVVGCVVLFELITTRFIMFVVRSSRK